MGQGKGGKRMTNFSKASGRFRQVYATCVYEQRLHFLAKIIKGVNNAKEQLKTYELDLAQETDTL